MEFLKLNCSQDNIINSYFSEGNSNQGFNPILEISALVINPGVKSLTRTLMKFDMAPLQEAINNGIISLSDPSLSATFKLYNVYDLTSEPLPANYDIFYLDEEWIEGNGWDTSTTGISNWNTRNSLSAWSTSGGTFSNSITSINFNTGEEDWIFDALSALQYWSNTSNVNAGIIIKLNDKEEDSTIASSLSATTYSKKMIYGREANNIFRPSINIQWQDKFTDNSSQLYYGSSGVLYFYNRNQQGYSDLDGTNDFPGILSITGAASTSLTAAILISGVTGQRVQTGIYKFNVPTIPLSGVSLTSTFAVWTFTNSLSAGIPSTNKEIIINSPVFNQAIESIHGFQLSVVNFKERIKAGDKIQYSVFIKKVSDVLDTLTAGSTNINSYLATQGYWKIVDERTGFDIYPWMDLHYNDTVNFFNLDTQYLYAERAYRIVLKIIEGGREFVFDTPNYYYQFYLYE